MPPIRSQRPVSCAAQGDSATSTASLLPPSQSIHPPRLAEMKMKMLSSLSSRLGIGPEPVKVRCP